MKTKSLKCMEIVALRVIFISKLFVTTVHNSRVNKILKMIYRIK